MKYSKSVVVGLLVAGVGGHGNGTTDGHGGSRANMMLPLE